MRAYSYQNSRSNVRGIVPVFMCLRESIVQVVAATRGRVP